MVNYQWQIKTCESLQSEFLDLIKSFTGRKKSEYLAQILWQRGIREEEKIREFLDFNHYQPTSPLAFGQEIKRAINRLFTARKNQEKIAIWGDFDADGVTATSVLWEGLGEFFNQQTQLIYYIPNRLTESHGLNCQGIETMAQQQVKLIVTCDTGSTNLTEIDYAQKLGIDIIITDHHTLPDERPPVISILNPRYFAENHPLYHLSGVAVAYKLIETLYQQFPDIPQQPLENLLDLVVIGLVADLVQLKGDCRYLAQKGIKFLEKTQRFGVKKLLELCKKKGDRPMDISFGIGPRINAISRIKGDASFCVELLTTKDEKKAQELACLAEDANLNRKEIQNRVFQQAKEKLKYIDLSTTAVIILLDNQWESGVLGLVANSIAQEYARPTILLTTSGNNQENSDTEIIVRGSARSVKQIDLYELLASQKKLLSGFGGHPFAAGLALPKENLSLFEDGINQQLKQQLDVNLLHPIIEIDLAVTVAELGKDLFQELKLLEPFGMGNPQPQLLIKNCWFTDIFNTNDKNYKQKKIKYIKTVFKIWDKTVNNCFSGCWWGHSSDEIQIDCLYNAIVELDFNAYNKEYEVRIIDLKLAESHQEINQVNNVINQDQKIIIDARQKPFLTKSIKANIRMINQCPLQWQEINQEYNLALNNQQNLALCYDNNLDNSYEKIWRKFLGIIKYLIKNNQSISPHQLLTQLQIGDRSLTHALNLLKYSGISYQIKDNNLFFELVKANLNQEEYQLNLQKLINSLQQEFLQKKYFTQVPVSIIQNTLIDLP